MRLMIAAIIAFIPFITYAQNTPDTIKYGTSMNEAWEMLKDGYTMANGWTIKEGDTLMLGKGTMPNHAFAFIYQSPSGAFTQTSGDNYNKRYLIASNKVARVKLVRPYGSKKKGIIAVAVVGVGEMQNYWVEIDNAIEAGELIPPAEYAVKKENGDAAAPKLSKADELKKWKDLLDAGAITQEEYDAQKKRILEQ